MPSREYPSDNCQSPQVGSPQSTVEESEWWWGWAVIDLLTDVPIVLARFLLVRLGNGIRRVIHFQHDRSGGKHGLPFTFRK